MKTTGDLRPKTNGEKKKKKTTFTSTFFKSLLNDVFLFKPKRKEKKKNYFHHFFILYGSTNPAGFSHSFAASNNLSFNRHAKIFHGAKLEND
jgi:hypothetical protein